MVDVPYISKWIIGWQRLPFIFGASADQGFRPPVLVPPSWRKMIGQWTSMTSMKIPKVNHPSNWRQLIFMGFSMGFSHWWSRWVPSNGMIQLTFPCWNQLTVSLEGMEWSCENWTVSAIWKMSETNGSQNPVHPVNSMSTSLPTFIPSSTWFHKEVP